MEAVEAEAIVGERGEQGRGRVDGRAERAQVDLCRCAQVRVEVSGEWAAAVDGGWVARASRSERVVSAVSLRRRFGSRSRPLGSQSPVRQSVNVVKIGVVSSRQFNDD